MNSPPKQGLNLVPTCSKETHDYHLYEHKTSIGRLSTGTEDDKSSSENMQEEKEDAEHAHLPNPNEDTGDLPLSGMVSLCSCFEELNSCFQSEFSSTSLIMGRIFRILLMIYCNNSEQL
jgi:hypothetical protein